MKDNEREHLSKDDQLEITNLDAPVQNERKWMLLARLERIPAPHIRQAMIISSLVGCLILSGIIVSIVLPVVRKQAVKPPASTPKYVTAPQLPRIIDPPIAFTCGQDLVAYTNKGLDVFNNTGISLWHYAAKGKQQFKVYGSLNRDNVLFIQDADDLLMMDIASGKVISSVKNVYDQQNMAFVVDSTQNVLLLHSPTRLFAIRIADGHPLWQISVPNELLLSRKQDRVIVWDSTASMVKTLDINTGKVVFSYQLAVSYNNILAVSQQGILSYLDDGKGISAVQLENGKQVWSYHFKDGEGPGSYNGIRGENAYYYQSVLTDRIFAVNLQTGREEWNRKPDAGTSVMILDNRMVLSPINGGSGDFTDLIRGSDGKLLWHTSSNVSIETCSISSFCVQTNTGSTNVVDDRSGRILWSTLETGTWLTADGFRGVSLGSPSDYYKDSMFLLTSVGIIAFRSIDGKKLWSIPVTSLNPNWTYWGQVLVISLSGGELDGIRISDGKQVWTQKLPI